MAGKGGRVTRSGPVPAGVAAEVRQMPVLLEGEGRAAFDGEAADYDAAFTETVLGRMLRARVWEILASVSRPGERVLELACGTGEDALWLAERGLHVVATDGAGEMLAVAAEKVKRGGLAQHVDLHHVTLQAIAAGRACFGGEVPFDGVLSNFGGLNTLPTWRPLAAALADLVRPGGWAVLVVMGPICPWEVGWHLLHLKPAVAARRWRGSAVAEVGSVTIPIWYPSPRHLQRGFAPWFRARAVHSLGLWLPPSYLGHLPARWPRLFRWLDRLERRTARRTAGWGDHYILTLERAPR